MTASTGTRARRRNVAEEPLPVVGGRYLVAAGIVLAMIVVPFVLGEWLTKTFGPKPVFTDQGGWKVGAKTELRLTLITADADRLLCAHQQSFDGIHCEYKTETERWPRDPGAALDDNKANIIQPYRTAPDNKLVLVSGLWAQPKVAWRLHREPPRGTPIKQLARFVAKCQVTFLGKLENVKTKWQAPGRWQNEPSAMVAKADSCEVLVE